MMMMIFIMCRELEAHGRDASWLKRRLATMEADGAHDRNPMSKPCITWEECMVRSSACDASDDLFG